MEENENIEELDIDVLAEMALEDESIADGNPDVKGFDGDVEGVSE